MKRLLNPLLWSILGVLGIGAAAQTFAPPFAGVQRDFQGNVLVTATTSSYNYPSGSGVQFLSGSTLTIGSGATETNNGLITGAGVWNFTGATVLFAANQIPFAALPTLTLGSLTNLPTSAAGYGIANGANIDLWGPKAVPAGVVVGTTDAQTLTNKSIAWSEITGPPTTLGGYGITNALNLGGGSTITGPTSDSSTFTSTGTLSSTGSASFTGVTTVASVSNTIFVDAGSGVDATATIGQPLRPYATASAAFAIATTSNTIYLRGNYTYTLSTTGTLQTGMTVMGDGMFTTTLQSATNLNAPLINNARMTTQSDSGIVVKNLTIDGNGANQSSTWYGVSPTVLFCGVSNLVFQNVQMAGTKAFNFQAVNCNAPFVDNIFILEANNGAANRDGIHLNGCSNGSVTNIKGTTYDDEVAVIAEEGNVGPLTISQVFSTSNMIVNNVTGLSGIGTSNVSSGVRIDGNSVGAFNTHVSNVTGQFARNSVVFDSTAAVGTSVVVGTVLSNISAYQSTNSAPSAIIAVESPISDLTVYGFTSTSMSSTGGFTAFNIIPSTFTGQKGFVQNLTVIGGEMWGATGASFIPDFMFGLGNGVGTAKIIGATMHEPSNASTRSSLIYAASYTSLIVEGSGVENVSHLITLNTTQSQSQLQVTDCYQTGGTGTVSSLIFVPSTISAGFVNLTNATTDSPQGFYVIGSGSSVSQSMTTNQGVITAGQNVTLTTSNTTTSGTTLAINSVLSRYTVATLPTATTSPNLPGSTGAMATVTDSAAVPIYNAAVSGGGSIVLPVISTGTGWTNH